jgi:hypothetical protein
MARKKNSNEESTTGVLPEAEGALGEQQTLETPPEESNELSAPPRLSNEILPIVQMAATTISKCSDNEVKNFCATADFICRQVVIQLSGLWKETCKTAQKNGKEGTKAAKVNLSISVGIDHSNLLIHTTSVDMGFSEKHTASGEIQEDLRQVQFELGT